MKELYRKKDLSYKEKLKNCSKKLIELDGKILANTILNVKDGILSLSLIPYIALYCRSVQEFFGEKIIDDDIDEQINDLRNGLKLFSGKYNKIKSATLNSDEQQNNEFKNMLKFKCMERWNFHYNLGVYIDVYGHIIGDTQFLNYILNISFDNIQEQHERAFYIGYLLGQKLAYILDNYFGIKKFDKKTVISKMPQYGYIDMNTNKRCQFFSKDVDKELNLIVLHMLTSVGFINNMLGHVFTDNNLWLNRVKYISAHYAWSGLKRVQQHYANVTQSYNPFSDNIILLINNGADLFPSDFRNCMMHYDFCNKGTEIIMEKYFSNEIPLFGLVESCFNGKSYDEFFFEVELFLNDLEKQLSLWFNVDIKKVKWDL